MIIYVVFARENDYHYFRRNHLRSLLKQSFWTYDVTRTKIFSKNLSFFNPQFIHMSEGDKNLFGRLPRKYFRRH